MISEQNITWVVLWLGKKKQNQTNQKKPKNQSADDLPYFIRMQTSWKNAHIPETEQDTPNRIDETLVGGAIYKYFCVHKLDFYI